MVQAAAVVVGEEEEEVLVHQQLRLVAEEEVEGVHLLLFFEPLLVQILHKQ